MKMNELEKMFNVVNYVLENEYHHFLECIDAETIDDDVTIQRALKDDDFVHIYKDALVLKTYLRTIVI
jgi:hypothetical protein